MGKEVLPGQTSFVDTSKDDTANWKLELVTKSPIKDRAGLLKALREHKFLNNEIKNEQRNLNIAIQDLERPAMSRIHNMEVTANELLKNIQQYASDNIVEFVGVAGERRHLDLPDFDIYIDLKKAVKIKPKASSTGAESEI